MYVTGGHMYVTGRIALCTYTCCFTPSFSELTCAYTATGWFYTPALWAGGRRRHALWAAVVCHRCNVVNELTRPTLSH